MYKHTGGGRYVCLYVWNKIQKKTMRNKKTLQSTFTLKMICFLHGDSVCCLTPMTVWSLIFHSPGMFGTSSLQLFVYLITVSLFLFCPSKPLRSKGVKEETFLCSQVTNHSLKITNLLTVNSSCKRIICTPVQELHHFSDLHQMI